MQASVNGGIGVLNFTANLPELENPYAAYADMSVRDRRSPYLPPTNVYLHGRRRGQTVRLNARRNSRRGVGGGDD